MIEQREDKASVGKGELRKDRTEGGQGEARGRVGQGKDECLMEQ